MDKIEIFILLTILFYYYRYYHKEKLLCKFQKGKLFLIDQLFDKDVNSTASLGILELLHRKFYRRNFWLRPYKHSTRMTQKAMNKKKVSIIRGLVSCLHQSNFWLILYEEHIDYIFLLFTFIAILYTSIYHVPYYQL